ncbi:hypothetical protein MKX79_03700 [Viridibacillus sp. FSL R5-0468]|uniref:hypothetical protein n=1 Tax=Viridibacillus sp. FSL R5-0468 TaxID=2921640 RepID=UPI0030FBE0E1
MELKISIPTASELNAISVESRKNYEKSVLEGPLLRTIVQKLEDAALEGLTTWKRKIDSTDNVRALKVISNTLENRGFNCEFKPISNPGLIQSYTEEYFIVEWYAIKSSNGGAK